jgi:hypothetical protein
MPMADAQTPREEPAHDVLAAEAFAVPAPDPVLHRAHEPARDVLAAEEFVVPAPDPVLHRAHEPARDVLAAEEFVVPAPDPGLHHSSGAHLRLRPRAIAAVVTPLGLLALRLLRRR